MVLVLVVVQITRIFVIRSTLAVPIKEPFW